MAQDNDSRSFGVAVQVGALRRTRSKLLLEVDQVRHTITPMSWI